MHTQTTKDSVYIAMLSCAKARKDCSAGGIFDAHVKRGGLPTAFGEVFLALQHMESEGRVHREVKQVDGMAVQWWFTGKAPATQSFELMEAA